MTWRVYAERDFIREELSLFVANFKNDVVDVVQPVQIVLRGEPRLIEATESSNPEPAIRLPRQLAEAVFSALAPFVIGTTDHDLVRTIETLRRERDIANRRLDQLIQGISRGVGGETLSRG